MDITINLAPILGLVFAIIVTFIVARTLNHKKDIHFKNKDVEITSEAFKRIGDVKNGTSNEIILNLQNVENNKEIFKANKNYEELDEHVKFLLSQNGDLQAKYEVLHNKFEGLKQAVGHN